MGLLSLMVCVTSFTATVMLVKATSSSLAKAPLFLLPTVTFSGALPAFSVGPSRLTVSDSWALASSGEGIAAAEPRGSLDPIAYLPVARLKEKKVCLSL